MAGLLYDPEEVKSQAFAQGLLGLGAQLMAAGAPSTRPGGMGQALGQGLLGFQQNQQGYMGNAMRQGLLGMQMEQMQQQQKEKEARDRAFQALFASPAGPTGGQVLSAAGGGPTIANASLMTQAQPPANPMLAGLTPDQIAMARAAGSEKGLPMLMDFRKEVREAPKMESGYDQQGREVKQQWDPINRTWKQVGGAKSNLPPGMEIGPTGQVQAMPGYTNVVAANEGAAANARLPSQKNLAAYNSELQTQSAIKVAEAGEKAKAPGKVQETELKLSDDFNNSPVVKNYREASTAFMGIMDAQGRDSKASDLNLVYGLAKLFDPGSVVREGETIMVQRTGGLSDQIMGLINSVNGGARLTPELRQGIVAEARGRMAQQQTMYDALAGHFESVAGNYKLDSKNIIPKTAVRIIDGDSDFEKLPSGTMFVGPDGQMRRKP